MRMLLAFAFALSTPLAGLEAGVAESGRSEFTLPNGLRVRLAPDRGDKDVIVILGVRAGFLAEPAGRPHVAHVAEHLVCFGGRPGSDEAKAITRWFAEGRANGETHLPFLYLDLHVKTVELTTALLAQASRLDRPTLTREALDREVPRTLGEVDQVDRSDEGYTSKFATIAFVQAALRGETDIPLRAKTRGLTVDDVRDFWTRSARPDRAILCVAGAFEPEAARKEIEAAFGTLPGGIGQGSDAPGALRPGRIDATWDLRARHLLLAWPVPLPSDPDHPALTVASLLLTQRLFTDPDIAALARHPFVGNDADGCFLINAYIRPGVDFAELEAKVLDRVRDLSGPRAAGDADIAQFRAAVGPMMGLVDVDALRFLTRSRRSHMRAQVELQRMLTELSWGDLSSYKARVDAIDAGAVRGAIARHLAPGRATIVRLGPPR